MFNTKGLVVILSVCYVTALYSESQSKHDEELQIESLTNIAQVVKTN